MRWDQSTVDSGQTAMMAHSGHINETDMNVNAIQLCPVYVPKPTLPIVALLNPIFLMFDSLG